MTLTEAVITWGSMGVVALAVFSVSYRTTPPLWLALLTVVGGPASFGASLITLLATIGEDR